MAMGMLERIASEKVPGLAIDAEYKFVKKTIHRPLSMENFIYIKTEIEEAKFKIWSLLK
mgnify:CR=1 FL=1